MRAESPGIFDNENYPNSHMGDDMSANFEGGNMGGQELSDQQS